MSLIFVLAMMTVAAIFAVLWPLRRQKSRPGGADVAVYGDQLEELERDRKAGLIGEAEFGAARVEIARRLIAAADAAERSGEAKVSPRRARIAAVAALLLLPVGAVALYGLFGSPALPGAPLASRQQTPVADRSIDSLVAQVEAHLERNPEDGRGWEVIAPVYLRLGRFEDAVKARRNALRLNGTNATREADYGEALVAAANGIVTSEARAAFERARIHEQGDAKARYFLGLAAEQDGKTAEASSIWREMLANAPADAAWTDLVRQSLARVDPSAATTVGPSAEDMAAAASLTPEQRSEMIRGMVDRLAARLKQDGSDLDAWQRLMRAYMALGQPDKAKAAAADARTAVSGDADKLRRLDEFVGTLGLNG